MVPHKERGEEVEEEISSAAVDNNVSADLDCRRSCWGASRQHRERHQRTARRPALLEGARIRVHREQNRNELELF